MLTGSNSMSVCHVELLINRIWCLVLLLYPGHLSNGIFENAFLRLIEENHLQRFLHFESHLNDCMQLETCVYFLEQFLQFAVIYKRNISTDYSFFSI